MPFGASKRVHEMCEVSVVFKGSKATGGVVRSFEPLYQDATCVVWPPVSVVPDSWASLPQHILMQILQHVPVQDRFRYCALVSSDWASAAIEATTDICMPSRCHNIGNLQSWLVQHGGSITAVGLTARVDQELVVLPCSKLRQLDLDHMSVQLLPTVGGLFPGILRDASRLTRFTLQNASVIGGPQALTGLAPLTDLRHLALAYLDTRQIPATNTDWFPVPGSILSSLVQLTHLELTKCVSSSTLEHLERLKNLEHLILGRLLLHNTSATALSGLESLSRLKWLCIEGLESHMSTSSVPALGQLTKLTRLQLLNCKGFQPILLSGMMNLQMLDIQGTPLLGTGGVVDMPAGAAAAGAAAHGAEAAGDGDGAAAGAGAEAGGNDAAGDGNPAAAPAAQLTTQAQTQAAAGAAALLLELNKLTNLTDLQLVQVLWAHAAGMQPAAYSALTASSRIQSLDLSFSLIPSKAWRSMFNPDLQILPHLHTLNIACSQAPMTDQDLSLMVQCCPGLRALGLKGTLKQGCTMEALLGFSTLTSLSVNHVSSDDVLAVLAELRGLKDLQMSVLSSIRASGLLQLTVLKDLTRLRVESSPETWIAKYGMVLLQNKAPPGRPSDVWVQLQSWCLHKIQLNRIVAEPPREKEKKANPVLRWLVRCVSE